MSDFPWLPSPVTLSNHNGDTIYYTQVLYDIFLSDIVNNRALVLFGKPVKVSLQMEKDGRHERFWHTITDPHSPQSSDIKMARAERICWIKPIIENIQKDEILVYERVKNKQKRLHLFIPDVNYIIILTERKNAYYFVTAFYIDYTYKLEEYKREHKKYGPKTKTAP